MRSLAAPRQLKFRHVSTITQDSSAVVAADLPPGVPANRDRLFLASCVALVVTAMTFAIRAGILNELNVAFGLTDTQLGWVNSMAFLGFPIAMMVGGLLYNSVGPRRMMYAAFACHVVGLVLTIFAGGFWGLIVSTFFIGFANGSVEAACNPLIVDMYPGRTTAMLNKFHVWFPGGIVIGSLVAYAMNGMGLGWQAQIGIMLIPTLLYAVLIFGQDFPRGANLAADTGSNLRALLNPLFIFIVACMTLTAATEFSTTQWVEKILGGSGANPLLVLALVSGVMAAGRFFAGPIVHRLNPVGVLWVSAVVAAVGIYLLTTLEGGGVYVAAVVFALGICYFWPTMIGITGEYTPATGALGLSLVGGAGMFSMTIWNPLIGGWLESAAAAGEAMGLSGPAAEVAAGREVLSTMNVFPVILVVLFAVLYFWVRNSRPAPEREEHLSGDELAVPASAR